jgi:hypothetical protein
MAPIFSSGRDRSHGAPGCFEQQFPLVSEVVFVIFSSKPGERDLTVIRYWPRPRGGKTHVVMY